MRVFLDTNVLVGAFTTRGICADVLSVVLVEHQLIAGESMLEELARVLGTKMQVPEGTVAEALALLRREGEISSTTSDVPIDIPDPDDVLILGEAIEGSADLLVTGDRDLLGVADDSPIPILTPRGFWQLLQGQN